MASLTVENYLKSILQLSLDAPESPVGTGQIAASLSVAPGTVTSMLKTLAESGLATYTPYEGVRLTPAGETLAMRVVRRHRLIEQFLVETLGLTWDEVHDEAEHMEHAVSDWLVDRIDEKLGYPSVDPHGDPIPTSAGDLSPPADRPLSDCQTGDKFRVTRVADQSAEFLRKLSEAGVEIGVTGRVTTSDPAGNCAVKLGGVTISLTPAEAAKLMVM